MIKYAEYYIENYKIEIFNSLFGKERVLLNGKKVSEKKSKKGLEHEFNVGSSQYRIEPQGKATIFLHQNFKVKKDGESVLLVNFLSHDSKKVLFFVVIVGLGIGFIVGRLLYDLLWPIIYV